MVTPVPVPVPALVVSQITPTIPKPVSVIPLKPTKQDGKWGFVNERKAVVITYTFDEVRPFSEGLAGVRVGDKWGFIDSAGEMIIPLRFATSDMPTSGDYKGVPALVFKDNKSWYASLKNGSKMCINKAGANVNCD